MKKPEEKDYRLISENPKYTLDHLRTLEPFCEGYNFACEEWEVYHNKEIAILQEKLLAWQYETKQLKDACRAILKMDEPREAR